MKKMKKVLTICLMAMLLMSIASTHVFALAPGDLSADDSGTEDIQGLGERVLGILQVIGVIVSVATLMILGIKYMMGSAEEKAEYKKTMIPYVIGAILIFGASTIAGAVFNFVG